MTNRKIWSREKRGISSEEDLLKGAIYYPDEIRNILIEQGLLKHYFLDKGDIEVLDGEGVKVTLRHNYRGLHVIPNFPAIGNSRQVFVSILIFVLSLFFQIAFPFSLLAAVGVGQLFSYYWFRPAIQALKKRVEAAIVNR